MHPNTVNMNSNKLALDQIKAVIAKQFAIDSARVLESARLFEDLNLDSMDSMALIMALEEHLGANVSGHAVTSIETVGDAVQLILTHVASSDLAAEQQ
jgi:acyl carrier protein